MHNNFFRTLLLFFILSNTYSYAQDTIIYRPRLVFGSSIGAECLLSNYKTGAVTDHLLISERALLSLKPFIFHLFLYKNIGVSAQLEVASRSSSSTKNANLMFNEIEATYPNYYVKYVGKPYFDEIFLLRAYVGVFYGIQKKKLSIYPQLSIGFANWEYEDCYFSLKERNTNQIAKLKYTYQSPGSFLMYLAGLRVSYPIYKRLHARVGIAVTHFNMKVDYTEEFTNVYTEEKRLQYYSYDQPSYNFNAEIGVSLIMKVKKQGRN
jgi:hypothetical protein